MQPYCPCHSKIEYAKCCKPYHEGLVVHDVEKLMRARFSAYAKGLVEFIINTTHKDNPGYKSDYIQWKNELLVFKRDVSFIGLDIIDMHQNDSDAYVVFKAHLMRKKKDVSFIERSYFVKVDGKWLYRSGEFLQEYSPHS